MARGGEVSGKVTDFRVLTRALGGSPLARLAMDGEAPSAWYTSPPTSADEWRARMDEVRSEFAGRAWLGTLDAAFAASGAARERLRRVADGAGVVVTTGQQPGLFGGPIYTWSKALSALALADALEQTTGIPTAPVFWAATYDADFAEASVTHVALGASVERLQMEEPAELGRGMRDTPLGDVSRLAQELERAAGSAADPALMDLVRSAYAGNATVGGAFVALLRGLLEPLGVAVLDAAHPAVRAAESPFLVRALRDAASVDGQLAVREREMRELGHEPQVAHVDGLSLVFTTKTGTRERVPIAAASFLARDGADAKGELEPNVLLRPLAERAILPTAAYAAGPGEIAYFAQASAVAAALGSSQPLAVPRWSGVIVEPHVQRILERHGLDVSDLGEPHAAEGRLARERLPDGVRTALARYREALDHASGELTASVAAAGDPLVPDAVLAGARNSIAHRLDRLERRVVAASKRQHEDMVRDLETARASLFPLGRPQERVLNLMPMLARHGEPLLRAMLERARAHAGAVVAGGAAHAGRELGS